MSSRLNADVARTGQAGQAPKEAAPRSGGQPALAHGPADDKGLRQLQALANQAARGAQQRALAERIERGPVQARAVAAAQRMQQAASMRVAPAMGKRPASGQPEAADSVLAGRTLAGQLSADEVRMPSLRMDLDPRTLQRVGARLAGIRDPEARPLARALGAGAAQVAQGRLHAPGLGATRADALGEAVSAAGVREAQLQTRGNEYRIMARFNPWLQVVGGIILNVDHGPVNKKMPQGWQWVAKRDLDKAKLGSDPVGKSWPAVPVSTGTVAGPAASAVPVSTGTVPASSGSGNYSVPSATFSSMNLPAHFDQLPAHQMPSVPQGYAYTGGPSNNMPWELYRDPIQVPASPVWGIDAEVHGSRLTYSSYVETPSSTTGNPTSRVLSAFAHTAPKGGGYGGSRDYPMDSDDYATGSGERFDRGHAVDHYDGSHASTASARNYVPEDPNFNRGARNHKVQELRRNGGGAYLARYEYSAAPDEVMDGTAIPTTEHFSTFDQYGTHTYYGVPNLNYPSSRKSAAADVFQQPSGNAPGPMTF